LRHDAHSDVPTHVDSPVAAFSRKLDSG
jgi:hypothetical protein